MLAYLSNESYFRSPSWRREAAESIARGTRDVVVKSKDDPIARLAKLLRMERHLSQNTPYSLDIIATKLQRLDADCLKAYEFFKHASTLTALSLQGHLLTELSLSQIADRFRISTDVVDLYSKLFFDVEDRLDNIEYIAGFVIGPVLQSGIEELSPQLLCRYFGYFGGSLVLQTMLYGATSRLVIKSDDEILGYLENSLERSLMIQTAATMLVHTPSRFDVRSLLEGYVAVKSIKRQPEDTEREWVANLVSEMRRINPIPRGTAARTEFANATGFNVEGLVAEPRHADKAGAMLGSVESIKRVESFKDPEILHNIMSNKTKPDETK